MPEIGEKAYRVSSISAIASNESITHKKAASFESSLINNVKRPYSGGLYGRNYHQLIGVT